MKYSAMTIPRGFAGTCMTVQAIQHWARMSAEQKMFKQIARDIVKSAPHCDIPFIVSEWVRRNIEYKNDPPFAEQLTRPDFTIVSGYGDCDDMVCVLATLCIAAGYKRGYYACIGLTKELLSHIYCETPNGIALDPTRGADGMAVDGDRYPARVLFSW